MPSANSHRPVIAALLTALLAAIGTAPVVGDNAATLDQIRDRARQIEEARQILADPDQTVRLAAFDAADARRHQRTPTRFTGPPRFTPTPPL